MSEQTKIVPRADGNWDMMRVGDSTYIIRNDLDYSNAVGMKFEHDSDEPLVFDVIPAMSGGDAYFGRASNNKYCIKDDMWIGVDNIGTGAGLRTGSLGLDFQGGDHYLQRDGYYYVIKNNTWARSSHLENSDLTFSDLSQEIINQDPLAFWGNGDYFYMLVDSPYLGIVVKRFKSLSNYDHSKDIALDQARISFLPGGLARTYEPTQSYWELLVQFENQGSTIEKYYWNEGFEVGQNTEETNSISQHWNVEMTSATSAESDIGAVTVKQEFSLTTEYGGESIETSTAAWNSLHTIDHGVEWDVLPGETWGLYRLVTGLGTLSNILLGQDVIKTDNGLPPDLSDETIAGYHKLTSSRNLKRKRRRG